MLSSGRQCIKLNVTSINMKVVISFHISLAAHGGGDLVYSPGTKLHSLEESFELTLARSPRRAKALCRTSEASSMQHCRSISLKLLCATCGENHIRGRAGIQIHCT